MLNAMTRSPLQGATSGSDRDKLFRRQVGEAMAVGPFVSLAYLASLVVVLVYAVPPGNSALRWITASAVCVVLVNTVRMLMPGRRRPSGRTARHDYSVILAEVVVVSILDVVLFAVLFGRTDPDRDLILITTVAGLIAGTAAFSTLRSLSLLWMYLHGLGAFVVLAAHRDPYFPAIVVQGAIYLLALTAVVLYLSASFQRRCLAEFQAESERQTVTLLLDGFEGGSRDWLWECDNSGRFTHVSARLAELAQMTVAELQHHTFGQLLTRLQINATQEGRAAAASIVAKLESHAPFREAVVPVSIGGVHRWWSLSGNPRLDPNGNILGWRGVGSDITDGYIHDMEIVRMAATDPLTGLPNRRSFRISLEAAVEARGPDERVLVGILDLDNFKSVNDTVGHQVGDQLLLEVSARLRSVLGANICSRMGGDEFGLIVRASTSADDDTVFDRYLAALQPPFYVEGNRIEVRATIGYASAPEDSVDSDSLIMLADLALNDAKSTGRNRIGKFAPILRARASARATALNELERGIQDGQFDLHYQPQVDAKTGEVRAFEALLRWNHPTRGVIGPGQFISVAEETGLIIPLGAHALEMATSTASTWPAGITVTVNVSPVQLHSRDFGTTVRKSLADSGLSPQALQIEITETGAVDERAIAVLQGLRALGVTVALDDFGTGYSSFASLQRLPIDVLKIDRLLVSDSEDPHMSVVRTVVELASALRMKSLAEGVETVEQFRRLQRVGCDLVQGYHISKPMSCAGVVDYLRATDDGTGKHVHPLTWL